LVARVEQQDLRRPGLGLLPPDVETLEAARSVERAALAIVTGRLDDQLGGKMGGQMSGQMSGTALEAADINLPTTTLRVSVSDEVARFWRGVEGVHRYVCDGDESFVTFLIRSVAASWGGAIEADVAYANIYQRDRWRCASPICRSTNVTPHHIVFRSHGGGEEAGNLVSVCEKCHLDLVHLGRIHVSGDAERGLLWATRGWGVENRARA